MTPKSPARRPKPPRSGDFWSEPDSGYGQWPMSAFSCDVEKLLSAGRAVDRSPSPEGWAAARRVVDDLSAYVEGLPEGERAGVAQRIVLALCRTASTLPTGADSGAHHG